VVWALRNPAEVALAEEREIVSFASVAFAGRLATQPAADIDLVGMLEMTPAAGIASAEAFAVEVAEVAVAMDKGIRSVLLAFCSRHPW
jgi:hypothetical protein